MSSFVDSIFHTLPVSDQRLEIQLYCQNVSPERHSVPGVIKPYWSERGELTLIKGLMSKGSRLLIPSSMRMDVLDKLHQGHLGITKCRERAKQSMLWSGISTQI